MILFYVDTTYIQFTGTNRVPHVNIYEFVSPDLLSERAAGKIKCFSVVKKIRIMTVICRFVAFTCDLCEYVSCLSFVNDS